MTVVGPEGVRQSGSDPDDWGVYEPVREQPWAGQPGPQPGPAGEAGFPARPDAFGPAQQPPPGPPPYQEQPDTAGEAPAYPWLAPDQTLQLRVISSPEAPPTGGRAERRRAAQGRVALRSGTGRRRATGPRTAPSPRPKESKRVIAARTVGELFITFGVVLLLFVAYQLWWTNLQADAQADGTRSQLEKQWNAVQAPAPGAQPSGPPAFQPGQGFAIIYLPKLGKQFPIAEGVGKSDVLDKGLVGHYPGTGMPADQAGNFALAAHRNTHGEPFRYINHLDPGDKVVVETATTFYTYQVTSEIPQTSPSNVSVILPVPKGSGYTQPGRYITLTTCTPEFTSEYRLIVFGKLVDERPRSQGRPPALSGQ